jgi:rhodanese-related sulfurtransferase
MQKISPQALKDALLADDELALIDVREQGAYSEGHLLFATCMPLSRLELMIKDLVPRPETPLVVISGDAEDGLAERAAARLISFGYGDTRLLSGGTAGWQAAGFEVFSGINVPSKAFGEFIEHRFDTPRLPAREVKAMLDQGQDVVIVDSRPFEEYQRMNIPGATDMPGAELAYRIHDLAPDPETFVVVNCAGRTRSIIGAQSLINAGIPNQVAALKDGTMGWHLAGFELERGATRQAAPPGERGRKKALAAAEAVARRFGVQTASRSQVETWRKEPGRTTFLLDVRSPAEFETGHLPGYQNAPGGQLVQATDEYVGVRNARLVLADDIGVRATMTASWLVQMGWSSVYVLEGGIGAEGLVAGPAEPALLGTLESATITADEIAEQLGASTVIDLGLSRDYDRAHIPGACWTTRDRLHSALEELANADALAEALVLTSADGLLARLALPEARAWLQAQRADINVHALAGGTDAWIAGGHPTSSGLEHVIGPTDDVWFKPYDHRGNQEQFMRDYLTWEVALVEQIEKDGTTRFRKF